MNIRIEEMKNQDHTTQKLITEIFVECFYELYSGFARSRKELEDILYGSFNPSSFVIAYLNDEPVGILGYADNKNRSLTLDNKKFKSHLGFIQGSIVYSILKSEFHSKLNYDDQVGYIEFIATLPHARGKKVAQSLMKHFFENSGYRQFVLEVGDTNEVAINTYKKLGFVEFNRKPDKHSRETGFNSRIFMIHDPHKNEYENANDVVNI